jgi:hypothetical protein
MKSLPKGAASFHNPASTESPPAEALEPTEKPPIPRPEKPRRSIWKRLLVWLLVILIAFSLGALLVLYTLYLPERQGLEAMQADLVQANQKVTELENRVGSLSGLDSKNKDLEGAMQESNLHVNLLKARADVATALLALAKNDPSRARVALSKTGQTLDAMKEMLDPSQQKTVDDMQSRLKLALGEIGTKAFAAESDLNVLSTSLMELENAYFAAP